MPEPRTPSPAEADAFVTKLREFHASLTADEQTVFESLLAETDVDVQGFSLDGLWTQISLSVQSVPAGRKANVDQPFLRRLRN